MTKPLNLNRIPTSNHPSLRAWNAADELMVGSIPTENKSIGIYNDTFGYLSCKLAQQHLFIITDLKSQKTAITENAAKNRIELNSNSFFLLTDNLPNKLDLAYLKIPKSLPLFESYLQHIHASINNNGEVVCGFMTKYFNTGLLELANKYFETVAQSKAKKKARLLFLKGKKQVKPQRVFESFQYHHLTIKQYKGIFSAGKVDKATNYLLENLQIPLKHNNVLDLACGNGIIGNWILNKTEVEEIHFLDDSNLAIASAKINVINGNTHFHHNYDLSVFDANSFDWIVTNPPFHFENTIDTSIPMHLFKQAKFILKPGGILTIVANSNLGYEPFLKQIFSSVVIQASNHQFKVFVCRKLG